MFRQLALSVACGLSVCAFLSGSASGIDTVTRKSTEKAAAGEITSVSKTEVVVTPAVGDPTTVPVNDIVDVDWEEAPPSLKLGRSQETGGQFDLALKSYQQAATENTSNEPNLRAEITFSIARVRARQALADPALAADSMAELKAFTEANRDHYRFYEAELLLGEVALAADDLVTADGAFNSVARAPWNDHQMAAKIGLARIMLKRNDIPGAKAAFDEVAAANAVDPIEVARKLEAMLGQAKCLQAQSQHAEAVKILDEVVRQSGEKDTRLQAEAYVRQGVSYAALGDQPKQAVMAFLHVDVVPSLALHADFHSEALYQLAQLWPTVGQPARAADAAARLEQEYPNSEWTKRLSGGGAAE
jgi:tetratricopeptide (TPR) repeat protein